MALEMISMVIGASALFTVVWLSLQFIRAGHVLALALSLMFFGEGISLSVDLILDGIRLLSGSPANNATAITLRLIIYTTTVATSLFLAGTVWKSQHAQDKKEKNN